MFRNYLTIAIRNLWRNKTFSLISILGLSLGMAGGFLLFLWVSYTVSFDRFHFNIDRIYHVFCNQHLPSGNVETWWSLPYPVAEKIRNEVPEVETVVQYHDGIWPRLAVGEVSFYEQGMYANPAFLTMFSFPLLAGDLNTALNEPNSIVITQKLAEKYFPLLKNELSSVLGKTIWINNAKSYLITGVLYNTPRNCNIVFDFILPLHNIVAENPTINNFWGDYNYRTYVLLRKDANLAEAQKKIEPILTKYSPFMKDDYASKLILFPHKNLNLYSKFDNGRNEGGKIEIVRIMAFAGALLLLVTCINFINLVLARTSVRMKEIGAHLVYGASRQDLFFRHFIEIFIQVFIASVVAALLLLNLWPLYQAYTDIEINRVFNISEISIAAYIVFVMVLLIAAIYPSWVLSSFKPNDLFHKKISKKFSLSNFNKGMIITQVGISSVFIIVSIFIFEQTQFILTKDLGQDISNVVLTRLEGSMAANKKQLKYQIEQLYGVEAVSFSSQNPLNAFNHTTDPTWRDKGTKSGSFYVIHTDYDYLMTLNIQLLQGRDFSPFEKTDTSNYLINETMYRFMDKPDVLGTELEFWGQRGKIIGVVNDFHYQTVHEPIHPLIIKLKPNNTYVALIRFAERPTNAHLAKMEKILKPFSNGNPIEFFRLENDFRTTYLQDINLSILTSIIALLAIIISVLGLLGITLFAIEGRRKEMSIRKVLGASPLQIHWLITKDFMLLVLIANVIAIPFAFFAVNTWLQNFAYYIEIMNYSLIFIIAAMLSITVAFMTISIQTLRAGMENPVKSLKYE